MSIDKEKIKKYRQVLPEEIRKIYDDPDTSDKIYDICVKYSVNHLDQMGVVDNAVYGLMLGLIKPNEVVPNIISETGIGEDIANLIIHDVNNQILKPIRETILSHQKSLQNGLPANAERVEESNGFSSMPYEPEPTDSPEKTSLMEELENPAAATVFTRNIFTEKKNGIASTSNLPPKTSPDVTPKAQPTTTPTAKKVDPYRESV